MFRSQSLLLLLSILLIGISGTECIADESNKKSAQKESKDKIEKQCKVDSKASKASSKITPVSNLAKSKIRPVSSVVKPMPSMSTETPAFQSSLTKLIRTKGHADHARYKGDLKKAKKLYLRCIKDPTVNHRSLGYCYKSLGDIYFKEKNNEEAEKYYKLAIVQMKKHKVKGTADGLQEKLDKLIEKKKQDR